MQHHAGLEGQHDPTLWRLESVKPPLSLTLRFNPLSSEFKQYIQCLQYEFS